MVSNSTSYPNYRSLCKDIGQTRAFNVFEWTNMGPVQREAEIRRLLVKTSIAHAAVDARKTDAPVTSGDAW